MDLAIETTLLTGGYGNSIVLRELSLRVPRASIYGFLGPNGAGKTTGIKMLLGMLTPACGEVRILGKSLPGALPGVLRHVGSLVEEPSLYDHLTGEENLEIWRRLRGLKHSDIGWAIQALGIEQYVRRKVREYSRGMRQRLGVAIALIGKPDLLLLDEPMNGLDPTGLQMFRSALCELREERGTTVLLSSHQLEEVERLATHVGILSHFGDLLFEGPVEELFGRIPQRLVIKVDRKDEALRALAGGGFTADANEDHLVIHGASAETAREANRVLVMQGVGVHHLSIELATLEQLFVKITTGSGSKESI
ncbi:MAG: ABC transporter ATP-binding protein [Bryobacteraceae bacterium]